MSLRGILIAFLCWFNCFEAVSQDPHVIKYNRAAGFPSEGVYDIFQDSKGYIWFCGEDGPIKYDGFRFTQVPSEISGSKAGNHLFEDKWGTIWMNSFDGKLFYIENDSVKEIYEPKPIAFFEFGFFDDVIYFFNQEGLRVIDTQTKKDKFLIHFKTKDILFSSQNRDCYIVTKENENYYFNDKGSLVPSKCNQYKAPYKPFQYPYSVGTDRYYSVGSDSIFSIPFSKSENAKFVLKIDQRVILKIRNIDSNYWICTSKGVSIFSKNFEKVIKSFFFEKISVSSAFKDFDGNYWVGTTNNGVIKIPELDDISIQNNPEAPGDFVVKDDKVITGSKNGVVYSVDLKTYSKKVLYKEVVESEVERFFINSTGKQLFFMTNAFHFLSFDFEESIKATYAVKQVCEIVPGVYALAASGIISLFVPTLKDKSSTKWIRFFEKNRSDRYPERFSNSLIPFPIRGKSIAYRKSDDVLFLASNLGIYKIDSTSYSEIKYNGKSVLAKKIVFINQRLILVSEQGLLFEIVGNEIIPFQQYSAEMHGKVVDVKCSNSIFSILTSKGIFQLNIASSKSVFHKIHLSLPVSEIQDFGFWENYLILSTQAGFVMSPPKGENEIFKSPPFLIEKISSNHLFYSNVNDLTFPPDENDLEISFAVLSFSEGEVSELEYSIDGTHWSQCLPQSRTLKLIGLNPGKYKVSFRYSLNNFICGEAVFKIEPPFWKTWWFYIVLFLIFLTGVFLIYRWQLGIQKRGSELVLEKVQLEQSLRQSMLSSIKSQMNPHFLFNALNTIQSFIISEDKKNAANYLGKFSKLTRLILEMSEREMVGLDEEILALNLYLELEKMRFEDLDYKIEFIGNIHTNDIKIPSMIIQPYVENAIKHGLLHIKGERILVILLKVDNNYLEITIDDNGVGRKRSSEMNKFRSGHQSFATSANLKRIELLNKEKSNIALSIEDKYSPDGMALGTKVIIRIPIN